jgi:hypothetical protein
VLRGLNDLNCDVVAHFQIQMGWHANLWQAELSTILVVAWTHNRHDRMDRMRHIPRRLVARLVNADVDVDVGAGMSGKPARLNRKSTTVYRPFGAVSGLWHTTACISKVSCRSDVHCGLSIYRSGRYTYMDTSTACPMERRRYRFHCDRCR